MKSESSWGPNAIQSSIAIPAACSFVLSGLLGLTGLGLGALMAIIASPVIFLRFSRSNRRVWRKISLALALSGFSFIFAGFSGFAGNELIFKRLQPAAYNSQKEEQERHEKEQLAQTQREKAEKLRAEQVKSVNVADRLDKLLYAESIAIASQRVNGSNFRIVLDKAFKINSNPRAALIVPEGIRRSVAQKAKEALAIAEIKEREARESAQDKERERIAKLPKKFKATMTNCFVDSPCESFERVAVVADGKVTFGDVSCPLEGRNDEIHGACSVSMEGGRPVDMREWDPADGFVLTRVSFGEQVEAGTYNPEMEANPYVKLQRERVGQILQEWEREKKSAKRNCKGLRGDLKIACEGAQSGN